MLIVFNLILEYKKRHLPLFYLSDFVSFKIKGKEATKRANIAIAVLSQAG